MDEKTTAAILQAAIQSEIEAHSFYQSVAEKTADNHLKSMFFDFAREELKHRAILEGFLTKKTFSAVKFERVHDFHVAETVDAPVLSLEMKPADAIALAMKKEETAMQAYNNMAAACDNEDQRRIFLELAAMERQHKSRMEIAFVDIGYPEVW